MLKGARQASGLGLPASRRFVRLFSRKFSALAQFRAALMRLSFGQQMQLAQKQVLAPRMIQSMEILQLPIMALQERIEQEMEEQSDARPGRGRRRRDRRDRPTVEEDVDAASASPTRARAGRRRRPNNEDDFERLLNMAENLPDDFEERSRPSLESHRRRRRSPARRDGQHGGPAGIARRLPAPSTQLVRDRRRRPAHGRADHLQPRLPTAT